MSKAKVTVGLVTWNSAPHLEACLTALREQTHRNLDLVLVDNDSKDGSVEMARRLYPQARVALNASNAGFCRAHNQAIGFAEGKYYLALNPDVVMEADYIGALVEALEERPGFGMAAGKLLCPAEADGLRRIDTTGLFIDRKRRQGLRGHREVDAGQFGQVGEVFGVDGAAPLYRRAMLEDLRIEGEVFDEAFFVHKEDVDLAWRGRLLGWKCIYTPGAVATHPRQFKPGQREQVPAAVRVHAVRNRYLLLAKNETPAGWRRDGLHILWYDLKILAYLLVFERSSLAALGQVRQLWPRLMRWRAVIRERMKVEEGDMLDWFKTYN